MSTDFTYEDHQEIDLQVILKSGATHDGLKCYLLRTYSQKYLNCDAHALIYFFDINGLIVDGNRIDPSNYDTFTDPHGQSWRIVDYKVNPPPEPPGLIFGLLSC